MSAPIISCLCGSISLPLKTTLPAPTELCHCSACRHTTGALCTGFVNLESAPPPAVVEKCTIYHTSKTQARYFCSTCGTKLFVHPHSEREPDGTVKKRTDEDKAWCVLGSAVDPPEASRDDVLLVEKHEWLADATDAGLAPFMSKLGGRDIPCFETKENEVSAADLDERLKTFGKDLLPPAPDGTLKAECRCGGVSLLIQRANHTERSVSQLDRFIPKNSNGNALNDKHIAMTCVCRYCRLHTGTSLAPWVYIPPVQIINPQTSKPVVQHRAALPPDPKVVNTAAQSANIGLTLKHYWSSPDCCRSFCSHCGAAVFYTVDRRQEVVNIAAGLLRAEEGVMARRWLSWQWGRVSWKDEATDQEIMKAWRATGDAEKL